MRFEIKVNRIILGLFALLASLSQSFAQQNAHDSVQFKSKKIITFLPTRSPKSYGLQIGAVGSETVCGYPYFKTSNGLNIQIIGQGAFWMFQPIPSYKQLDLEKESPDTLLKYDAFRAKHNGLLFSTLGAIDTRVNGVSISFFYGHGKIVNGLALNLMRNKFNFVKGVELGILNEAGRVLGVQIGLLNFAKEVHGIQLGLWNVNEKRKLPIINW